MNQTERERYFRRVRRRLAGPRAEREAYWKGWMENVAAYLDQYPEASLEDLESRFGTPEKVAENCIEAVGAEPVRACAKRQRWVAAVLACTVAVALLAWGATLFMRYQELWGNAHGFYVEVIRRDEEHPGVDENGAGAGSDGSDGQDQTDGEMAGGADRASK